MIRSKQCSNGHMYRFGFATVARSKWPPAVRLLIPSERVMHRLLSYQNFFREEDPTALEARLKEATASAIQELYEQLSAIDDNWLPAPSDEPVAGYLEAAKTFGGGVRKQTVLHRLDLDVSYIKKLLLYYPRVDVTLPYFRADEDEEERPAVKIAKAGRAYGAVETIQPAHRADARRQSRVAAEYAGR
jgi:hypothetical protein